MVKLSQEVSEALAEEYGEDILEEYESLDGRTLTGDSYGEAEDILHTEMHPDNFADTAAKQGTAAAIRELSETVERYEEAALRSILEAQMEVSIE